MGLENLYRGDMSDSVKNPDTEMRPVGHKQDDAGNLMRRACSSQFPQEDSG